MDRYIFLDGVSLCVCEREREKESVWKKDINPMFNHFYNWSFQSKNGFNLFKGNNLSQNQQ